jgi:beta-lactam-binding protein with PASTA domain
MAYHEAMDGVTGFLVAVMTSAGVSAACVYGIERSNLLPPRNVAPPEATVPDLHAMTETDARSNANASHVALFVAGREASADLKPGTVIRQSIAAGRHVLMDSTVDVVLADEAPRVPGVANLPVAQATYSLEQAGYAIYVAGTIPDAKIPEGAVVSQVPKANSGYLKGGPVIVELSAGPGEVEVPKLVGTGITTAKTQVEQLGLKATVRWITAGETPVNVVLSQDPAAGKKLKPGGEVQLTACTP